MIRKHTPLAILLGVFFILPFSVLAATGSVRAFSRTRYSKAHSLGHNYVFDPRDGWRSVNATNLQYKYPRDTRFDTTTNPAELEKRNGKPANKSKLDLSQIIKNIFQGIKAIGKPQDVIITWYTGNDLLKPSCWADNVWAPTDQSFACALTQDGWDIGRPKCFTFIELCNTPMKCVFVRVVDTCGGCTPGSRHVDLTKAAFHQLADYDVGQLNVKLRIATDPDHWFTDLWGPKANHTHTDNH